MGVGCMPASPGVRRGWGGVGATADLSLRPGSREKPPPPPTRAPPGGFFAALPSGNSYFSPFCKPSPVFLQIYFAPRRKSALQVKIQWGHSVFLSTVGAYIFETVSLNFLEGLEPFSLWFLTLYIQRVQGL